MELLLTVILHVFLVTKQEGVFCLSIPIPDIEMEMEECAPHIVKRLDECINRSEPMLVNTTNFACIEANRQHGCDEGERLVLSVNKQCLTTKCIKNMKHDGHPCADGELPFNDECYDMRSPVPSCGVDSSSLDVGVGVRLKADVFGNVVCNCSDDQHFFRDGCYSEFSFRACNNGNGSTKHQLFW